MSRLLLQDLAHTRDVSLCSSLNRSESSVTLLAVMSPLELCAVAAKSRSQCGKELVGGLFLLLGLCLSVPRALVRPDYGADVVDRRRFPVLPRRHRHGGFRKHQERLQLPIWSSSIQHKRVVEELGREPTTGGREPTTGYRTPEDAAQRNVKPAETHVAPHHCSANVSEVPRDSDIWCPAPDCCVHRRRQGGE